VNAKLKSEEEYNGEFSLINSFARALYNLVVVVPKVKY